MREMWLPGVVGGFVRSVLGSSLGAGWLLAGALFPASSALAEPVVSYAEVAQLLASEGDASDLFGWSVAIDGDTLVVGALRDESGDRDRGAAYVFEREPGRGWIEVARLVDTDDAADEFGHGVDISGDTIVVGAARSHRVASDGGAAYVFDRNAGGPGAWGLAAVLVADDLASGDLFGESVGIDDDTIVVGAPKDNGAGAPGTAYVFERDEGGVDQWGQVSTLLPLDALADDRFGVSVGISGDWILVGAPGPEFGAPGWDGAYLFEQNSAGPEAWEEVTKLTGLDTFGEAVAIDGNTAVVGAYNSNLGEGSVGIFVRDPTDSTSWPRVAALAAPDRAQNDRFGRAVAIDGDLVAIGAYWDDDRAVDSGSAYVFERNQGGAEAWGKVAKLLAVDGAGEDSFGWSLALDGEDLLVGVRWDDDLGSSAGSALLFEEITVDPTLEMAGACPGTVDLTLANATPLGDVAALASEGTGPFVLQAGLCAGTELELGTGNLLEIVTLGSNGELALSFEVQADSCGFELQLVDLTTCAASNASPLP